VGRAPRTPGFSVGDVDSFGCCFVGRISIQVSITS
jgi:hypothetical protein